MKLNACSECCSPVALQTVHHSVGKTYHLVICQSCGAGPNKAFADRQQAVVHWNLGQKRTSFRAPRVEALPDARCVAG